MKAPSVIVLTVESLSRYVVFRSTLVAGDGDYVPAIEKLKKRGITVHVVFWAHAAQELRLAATKFIALDPFLEHLARPAR